MLTTESRVIKRTSNLIFLGLLTSIVVAFIFRAELSDTVIDELASQGSAVDRQWVAGKGGRLVLRPERNDPLLLRVDGLRSGHVTSLGVPVSFDLFNLGDANDFPAIAVVMTGAGGQALREIVFSPKEYAHARDFGKQHVELLVQPRPGEQALTVRAFYGELP